MWLIRHDAVSGVFRMCERRGPRGSGGRKFPSGVQGQSPGRGLGDLVPQKLTFFVTECLNFDVLEEKISKTAKKYHHKKYGWLKGGAGLRPPLNTPLDVVVFLPYAYVNPERNGTHGRSHLTFQCGNEKSGQGVKNKKQQQLPFVRSDPGIPHLATVLPTRCRTRPRVQRPAIHECCVVCWNCNTSQ